MAEPFVLPPLPYADTALAPVISANTLGFHYGKHHKTYVDNLNNLVKGTAHEGATLDKVIRDSAGKADQAAIFNNSAQIWNHTFYWHSLKPNGGGKPAGKLARDDRQRPRRLRQLQEGVRGDDGVAVRLRLGLAGRRRRQAARSSRPATPRFRSPRARRRC